MLKATCRIFVSISHHNVEIFLETITSHRYEIIVVHTLATARYNYNSYKHSCVFSYNSGHEVVKLIGNEIISCLVRRQAN